MDLGMNEEQKLLADTARDIFTKAGSRTGELPKKGLELRQNVWNEISRMGLTGLVIDEAHGGSDAGVVEAWAALLAAGQTAATEPLLDGSYLASWLIQDLGSETQKDNWLPRIASGEAIVPLAVAEKNASWCTALSEPSVTVDNGTMTGSKVAVAVADSAALFLVTAVENGTLGVYLAEPGAEGVSVNTYRAADWTRSAVVTFNATKVERLGEADTETVFRALQRATALGRIVAGGKIVGLSQSALSKTVDYLGMRKQFGVPLKAFQALTFRAAQLYSDVELTHSAGLWAVALAEKVGDGAGNCNSDVERLSSVADDAFCFLAGQARQIAEEATQLHGGIGMTYEAEISHCVAALIGLTQVLGGVLETRARSLQSSSLEKAPSVLLNNDLVAYGEI